MEGPVPSTTSRLTGIPLLPIGNLALALLALPLLSAASRTGAFSPTPVGELAIEWTIAIAVVGIAVGVEGRSYAEIGFRRPGRVDFVYLLATSVAALLVFAGTDPLVTALGFPVSEGAGTMTAGVGIVVALAGAVTTGIVEEILFRSYPIERLLDWADSAVLAGTVTWGAFTVAHVPVWPVGNLVQIAAVAAVFTAVYLRRRTLVPVVGAHALVWVVSVLGQFYG